ncbi:MAG: CPBP family intramembrane metalloprotease [Lachnospiraceae bacterium]|nr:CPBP family intramembrane metalloprotease [Lachnospiraceae bacterium]
MNNKSIIKGFLFPTLLQITVVAALVGILKGKGYELGYNSFLGIVFIIFGGVSSALWGVFYQIKYNAKRPLSILKDFFNMKQSIKSYAIVLVFLFMDFCSVIVSKGFKIESLLVLVVLFFKAIVFGGIEEIGWRYSFQPCLEKKIPYIVATIITFLCWSVWHFLFFYIDGSIEIVNVPYFVLGLLTNCFIFSALFAYSNSLWICVMTHALINTLSQITINDNALIGNISKVVCICFASFLFHVSKKKRI